MIFGSISSGCLYTSLTLTLRLHESILYSPGPGDLGRGELLDLRLVVSQSRLSVEKLSNDNF